MKQNARAPRAARLQRLRTDALTLVHPDRTLVEAVERQKASLLDDPVLPDATALGARAFTALVTGHSALARQAVAELLRCEEPGAPLLQAGLVAQLYGWTADGGGTQPLLEAALALLGRTGDSVDRRVIARDLIALVEAAGVPDQLAPLRRHARGADPDRSSAGTLLGLLAAREERRTAKQPLPPHATGSLTRVAHDLLAGRTARGVAGWTALAAGSAGDLVLPLLAAGILGLDPDAERGRLRARLHVPEVWPAWGATAIRVGDAAIDLHVARDAGSIAVTADQTDGALPLTLLLEVTVHAPIRAVRVDAMPASLAVRPFADRVIAPIQLVLEAARTLTLELDTG